MFKKYTNYNCAKDIGGTKVFGGVKGDESPASQPASHFGKFTTRLHRMIHRIFMVYEQQAIPTLAMIYVCSFVKISEAY